jgi:uncharacterized protein
VKRAGPHLLLSPSDLSAFVACPHLTQLERAVAEGTARRPVLDDPHAELVRQKGREHEAAYLRRLEAEGRRVLRLPRLGEDGCRPEEIARLSQQAIRAGEADVIYQAHLADGPWRGFADFLERQEDGAYEPVDTKLARAAKPEHLLQLCFYAERLEGLQGRLPEQVHVETGSGRRQSFRTAEFLAYYRRVRARFVTAVEERPATYPWPCEHCPVCAWRRECHGRLVQDDHLVLVAGLPRSLVDRFTAAGLTTLAALGEAERGTRVEGVRPESFAALRHQAELQLHRRRSGEHRVDLLPVEEGRGFLLLPEPTEGDVWLDLEDHPLYEPGRGLEYLFGYCHREDGELRYRALWATDRQGEKRAFERLVDWLVERRRRFPGLHVYHYGNKERAALRGLMGVHGTREEAIDDLLRGEVLVDLYRVLRQALRASVAGYSIKEVEALYGFERAAEVAGGRESTVRFDQWLQCGEPSLLDQIARYNEDDCRSAAALHQWLLARRPAGLPWRAPPQPRPPDEEAQTSVAERERVLAGLLARSQGEGDPQWLLAQLLEYHRREARPEWWEWFLHLELDDEERIGNTSTLGGLEVVGDPVPDKRSLVYTLSFPPQDHKIAGAGVDPATGKAYQVEVDDERGLVRLRRGAARRGEPLPRALIPGKPVPDAVLRDAVLRFARSYLAGDGAYPALVAVLERRPPRVDLRLPPARAALTLDRSYLFVQGPPGAGKTWQGAKMAVALMREGRRVGVTSLSHRAIHKLLAEIEREAAAQGFAFRGRKKHTEDDQAYVGRFVDSSSEWEELLDPELRLLAGTAWLFARPDFDRRLDALFVDEAGQVALADVLAGGTAARSLVLLGDPNQLPQVSRGAQPEPARASALRHLLGERETVPPDLGIFLPESWRLRPELCAFTSEVYYKGRLAPAEVCARRSLGAGDGLAVLPVAHEGRSQSSWEEADAVAAEIGRLLGTPFTDEGGRPRPLGVEDVLVVAPYNAQVRALRARVPAGVRVGTVDKFQGQEAPVVLVSLASSSGADAPRGIAFAFDRHRHNVATSRAQCRVVLVCAPRLLEAECRTVEHMRLMNAACRFAELARVMNGQPASGREAFGP